MPSPHAHPAPLVPTAATERIHAIDAARGFALLGILFVNIQSFAEPFGMFMIPKPPDGSSLTDTAAFYFVKVFCESKFYPLFAMLFGFGLMMQADRARRRGQSYWAPGARRYLFLTFLGLLHALGLWFGDILFLYGVGGLFLLLMHRAGTRAMAITGGVFLGLAVLLMSVFTLISTPGHPDAERATTPEPALTAPAEAPPDSVPQADSSEAASASRAEGASEAVDSENSAPSATREPSSESEPASARVIGDGKFGGFDTPVMRLFESLGQGKAQNGPSDPVWIGYERQAYTSGNPADRLLFNAFNWAMFLVVCLMGFGWDVLAMLLLGAVLFRARFFADDQAPLRRRLIALGLLVGLPMSVLGAAAPYFMDPGPAAAVFSVASLLFGPMLSLAYVGVIAWAVNAGVLRFLTAALSNVGRLALTNYLTQTVVCSFLFYEWGLHLYDQTTRTQRVGIVLGLFAAQLVLSTLYFKVFKTGPMEALWRTVTYLRLPGSKSPA